MTESSELVLRLDSGRVVLRAIPVGYEQTYGRHVVSIEKDNEERILLPLAADDRQAIANWLTGLVFQS